MQDGPSAFEYLMNTCPECGSPNDETLTRCARCNARLPRSADPDGQRPTPDDVEPVKSHTGLVVLATLLFVPFGLVAVVQAAQVNGWYAAGQHDRAERASQLARRWAQAGIIAGLIINPLLIAAAWLV